jgi:hypothetical protein
VLERQPLYNSFEKVEHRRDARTMERYEALPEEPGLAHALDAKNTRESDPWRRYGVGPAARVRHPHFYDHDGPRAACGRRVRVAVPSEYSPEDPDSCPDCAELVRSGEAWGRFAPRDGYYECGDFVRIEEDGEIEVYECPLRNGHRGPHRSRGATWTGPEDFIP